jgi:hypothetical protein
MFRFMEAIASPIQTLLDLFSTHLGDVRFGDLDQKSLARGAADVEAAAAVVASAQSALDAARDALHERQEALLAQSHRAFAYARVYADGDDTLIEKLESIALPRPARRAKASGELVLAETIGAEEPRRPRGRPRKASAPETAPADALLFNGK